MVAEVLDGSSMRALGERAEAMINELAAISAEPHRLVRQFLTPEHRRAAELVAGWMRKAGMQVFEDALGTRARPHAERGRAAPADRVAYRYRDRCGQIRRAARRDRRHPGGRALRPHGAAPAVRHRCARVRRRGRLALPLDAGEFGRGGRRVRSRNARARRRQRHDVCRSACRLSARTRPISCRSISRTKRWPMWRCISSRAPCSKRRTARSAS